MGSTSTRKKPKPQGSFSGGALIVLGILFVIGIVTVPVLLLLPAIGSAREAARRGGCLSNIRQLGLAAASYESRIGFFPAVSASGEELTSQVPGSGNDGYSVLVRLLPYMEEQMLHEEISSATEEFQSQGGPFALLVDSTGRHFAERNIPVYRCPSFSGETICLTDAAYADGSVLPAVGNYVAIVATDLEGADGNLPAWKGNYQHWENGGLVSSCAAGDCALDQGLTLRDIGDGISKQIIMSESRERRYASWFSSASTWVVPATGGTSGRESRGIVSNKRTELGDGSIELISGELALNWGDSRAERSPQHDVYLSPAPNRWAAKHPRVFGPSSEHSGGIVLHVFADAHAKAVSNDVDPQMYLRLITRADAEPPYT